MSDAPPPGWYGDPIDSNRTRYWDGSRWTDHVRDPATPPPFGSPGAATSATGDSNGTFVQTPSDAAGQRTATTMSPTGRRNRALLGVAAGLVALLLVGGLLAMLRSDESGDDPSAQPVAASEEPTPDREPEDSTPDREAVQERYDAEVHAACQRLKADVTPEATEVPIVVTWDQDYKDVLNVREVEMRGEVRECVQPAIDAALEQKRAAEAQRQAEAAAAEQAAIENAGPADVDAIVKNPDAVKGQIFRLVAVSSQMDAATGPCIFRGYWDNTVRAYNYEYEGDNAMFITTPAPDATSECPIFDGIDQDDTMTLTVRGQGSFSYDTQIGGNTTVPLFQVLRVDKVVKG